MKTQERRLGVAEIDGWHIESITITRFEATKDGETVTLEADTLEQMELLIALREGLVKHELPIRRPDGSEVGGEEGGKR